MNSIVSYKIPVAGPTEQMISYISVSDLDVGAIILHVDRTTAKCVAIRRGESNIEMIHTPYIITLDRVLHEGHQGGGQFWEYLMGERKVYLDNSSTVEKTVCVTATTDDVMVVLGGINIAAKFRGGNIIYREGSQEWIVVPADYKNMVSENILVMMHSLGLGIILHDMSVLFSTAGASIGFMGKNIVSIMK